MAHFAILSSWMPQIFLTRDDWELLAFPANSDMTSRELSDKEVSGIASFDIWWGWIWYQGYLYGRVFGAGPLHNCIYVIILESYFHENHVLWKLQCVSEDAQWISVWDNRVLIGELPFRIYGPVISQSEQHAILWMARHKTNGPWLTWRQIRGSPVRTSCNHPLSKAQFSQDYRSSYLWNSELNFKTTTCWITALQCFAIINKLQLVIKCIQQAVSPLSLAKCLGSLTKVTSGPFALRGINETFPKNNAMRYWLVGEGARIILGSPTPVQYKSLVEDLSCDTIENMLE